MESNWGKLEMMFRLKRIRDKYIDEAYQITLAVKGIFALFQVVGSVIILFLTPNVVRRAVYLFTRGELTDDPDDAIATYLVHTASSFSVKIQMFAFLYLLSHGAIKLLLVWALWKKKLWAYPASIGVFGLFIVYQMFRYFEKSHSVWLLALSIFDVFVIWIIWREYKLVKQRIKNEIPQSEIL